MKTKEDIRVYSKQYRYYSKEKNKESSRKICHTTSNQDPGKAKTVYEGDTLVRSSWLFVSINLLFFFYNLWWYPGEVTTALKIAGGSAAIYFLFLAKSFDEKSLSLLSCCVNNASIFYLLNKPDLCCFLVVICIILLVLFHLSLWFSIEKILNSLYYSVILSRGFYHPTMGYWGFGLVTELLFINLFFLYFQNNERRIYPLLYLITCSSITLLNLIYCLQYGVKDICIYIILLFASAACVFLSNLVKERKELSITYLLYIVSNITLGFLLSPDLITFAKIVGVSFIANVLFVSFFVLKAQRSKKTLAEIPLDNNREGIQTLLVVHFLLVDVFMKELTPVAASLNWGIGLQIGFLGILNYFFKREKGKG